MKIVLGSDHAGFKAKQILLQALTHAGHQVTDVGTLSQDSTDYPDYAAKVARAVAAKKADRGLLACGTGIGMCIAANKVKGIRAGNVWSEASARLAAEHNDVNVLCLSARFFPVAQLVRFAKAWLNTPFAGGRHARRVRKILSLERTGGRSR